MIVLKKIEGLKLTNLAITIGMFDGLHKGHIKLIEAVKKYSELKGCNSAVMSFDMKNNLRMNKEKIILNSVKTSIIRKLNVDYYISLDFDDVKNMSPLIFIEHLVNNLGVNIVVCGADFRFGHKRQGDILYLQKILEEYGKELHIIETEFLDEEKISSSNIRLHIKNGEIKKANELLGKNFSLDFLPAINEEKYLLQIFYAHFLSPPNGRYISIFNSGDIRFKTYTIIDEVRGRKIAKTYTDEPIFNDDVSIELIDKC